MHFAIMIIFIQNIIVILLTYNRVAICHILTFIVVKHFCGVCQVYVFFRNIYNRMLLQEISNSCILQVDQNQIPRNVIPRFVQTPGSIRLLCRAYTLFVPFVGIVSLTPIIRNAFHDSTIRYVCGASRRCIVHCCASLACR